MKNIQLKYPKILTLGLFLIFLSPSLFANENPKALIRKARKKVESGLVYEAREIYLDAIRIDSNNYDANLELGLLLTEYMEHTDEAGKYLSKAEKLSRNDTLYELIFELGRFNQLIGRYKIALSYYKRLYGSIEESEEGREFKKDLEKNIRDCEFVLSGNTPKPIKKIKVVNSGKEINTIYPEYVPVINPSEDLLLFTSRRPDGVGGPHYDADKSYFEDIYVSKKVNEMFQNAHHISANDKELEELANTNAHESVISFSPNGKRLFIYKSGLVYEMDYQNGKFGKPFMLDSHINIAEYQNHASITADEQTLFFSSENIANGRSMDIYMATKTAEGTWGNAVNLGNVINSPYDEEGPEISPDGKVLYFASRGHDGFGGFDLYKSVFENGTWSEPINLGEPINSPADDIFLKIKPSSVGKEYAGFFSSDRKGGYGDMDIYEIVLNKPAFFEDCMPYESTNNVKDYVKFNAPDTTIVSTSVSFNAAAATLENEKIIAYHWKLEDSVYLDKGVLFNYAFSKKGTFNNVLMLETNKGNFYCAYKKMQVLTKEEMEQLEAAISNSTTNNSGASNNSGELTLDPVFFEFNSSKISMQGEEVLRKNCKTIKENTAFQLVLSAHCDSRGSSSYNKTLSIKRAKSVMSYLLSQGIDRKTIKAVLFLGETELFNECKDGVDCDENKHESNRRVTFKLVKKTKD